MILKIFVGGFSLILIIIKVNLFLLIIILASFLYPTLAILFGRLILIELTLVFKFHLLIIYFRFIVLSIVYQLPLFIFEEAKFNFGFQVIMFIKLKFLLIFLSLQIFEIKAKLSNCLFRGFILFMLLIDLQGFNIILLKS